MKYLLTFVLAFVVHKGLEEVYDYSWEKAFNNATCQAVYDDNKLETLRPAFECTYKEYDNGLFDIDKLVSIKCIQCDYVYWIKTFASIGYEVGDKDEFDKQIEQILNGKVEE